MLSLDVICFGKEPGSVILYALLKITFYHAYLNSHDIRLARHLRKQYWCSNRQEQKCLLRESLNRKCHLKQQQNVKNE